MPEFSLHGKNIPWFGLILFPLAQGETLEQPVLHRLMENIAHSLCVLHHYICNKL